MFFIANGKYLDHLNNMPMDLIFFELARLQIFLMCDGYKKYFPEFNIISFFDLCKSNFNAN